MDTQWSSSLVIEVDGVPLDPLVADLLVGAVVENSMHLPDMFELVFTDPAADVAELGGFVPGAEVVISVDNGEPVPVPLVVGEVTALELEYDQTGKRTIIRGLDLSNRLMRGKKTRVFEDMLASEIVEEILAENGIELNEIEPTDDLIEYKLQAGVTDWDFIQTLAMDCGYRAYMSDGVFTFAPAVPPVEGDVPGTLEESGPTQIVVGDSLIRLRAVVRSNEQVEDVQVTGWSPLEDAPVIGVSPAEAIATETVVQPEELASVEGANSFLYLGFPTADEDAAETKAAALGNQLAESYAELEGECMGDAALKAGVAINLSLAGASFDGAYTLTSTRHVFSPESGYTTQFSASGWQDRTLLGLAKGPEVGVTPPPQRINGVVSATVVNVRDPEEQGRVQVLYEWMDTEGVAMSDWARVVQIGAGEGFGFFWLPEEGDEVLVSFEQGDPSRPVVLGSLYNTVLEPAAPAAIDEATGLVAMRRISSRFYHNITFLDSEEQTGILIETGDELAGIFLDADEQVISIYNLDGDIAISGTDIQISAEGDLSLEAVGELSISAASVTIEGEGDVSLSGAAVELTAEGEMSLDGPIVTING
ncbi:MAG TPA: VgrG-related protein [Acidimicrobiales bacterium]|nr:VgrG-related protein [Acidimicrobiales bacterium]